MRVSRQLSNDPNMSCRVFCNICDRLYFLSGLRKHVAKKHSLTFTEYKGHYGDPKRQIVNLVYHSCVLCKKIVILDTTELSKHLKSHKLGYTQYMKEHMRKGSGLIQSKIISSSAFSLAPVSPAGLRTRSLCSTAPSLAPSPTPTSPPSLAPSLPPTPPPSPPLTVSNVKKEPEEILSYFTIKEEPVESLSPTLVVIQCHHCFRVFKQNKQLQVHVKKVHSR